MSSLLGSRIGIDRSAGLVSANAGLTTYAMAALNTGWSARFAADAVDDVLSVLVNWTAVTTPGQVDIRLETDDGTGKPSGTLYDANAVLAGQTPAVGTQTYTFAVAPTTGLTIGTMYHVVILTTVAGTTQTLGSSITVTSPPSVPTSILTAADGTVRTNFAVVGNTTPALVLLLEGSRTVSREVMCHPYVNTTTQNNVFGTAAAAAKIVTEGTLSVIGIALDNIAVTGTPAGDLRIRMFDSGNNVVSGTTITVDKDTIVTARGIQKSWGTAVSLSAGTYRIVFDSAASVNSSNCYNLRSVNAMSANAVPNCTLSTTVDVTATPPTWTDTATAVLPATLLISGITASEASSSRSLLTMRVPSFS